jgi:Skp family chaperone for outer membrane proteins
MRKSERVVVYGLLAGAMGVALMSATGVFGTGQSRAFAAAAPEAQPAKIATCDFYLLVERMVDTDAYAPVRKAEEARISGVLSPIENELNTMNVELQNANPTDAGMQEKYKMFETKRSDYLARRQDLSDSYSRLVSGQFVEAYEKVIAEAKKIANQQGYTYVIAHKSGKITAMDPRRLVEDFLARPLPVAPDGADITEQVRMAMNLPAQAAPATTGTPATTTPNLPAEPATQPR